MVLYWDSVLSIVPWQFVDDPESLGSHMLDLVREQLVVQVIPAQHLYDVPRFAPAFDEYLKNPGIDLKQRQQRFLDGKTFKVHIEKLGSVANVLIDHRLAQEAGYPWYSLEADTADDFMSYLATCLGQLGAIDADPMTDNREYLQRLAHAGVREAQIAEQLDSLRSEVLTHLFPAPTGEVPAADINAFKTKHQTKLGAFRRRVEAEIIKVTTIPDELLRARQLELFYEEARERMDEIQAYMVETGWTAARGGLSVLAAVPGVSQLFGLLAALWDTSKREGQSLDSAFAYAACAEMELSASAG
jgi:hypothetical protein